MDLNETSFRYSVDAEGLNATIREGLVNAANLKIRPFTGEEDVYEWLSDYEMLAKASDWKDETKAKKFAAHLRKAPASWFRHNFGDTALPWPQIKDAFFKHHAPQNYNLYVTERISNEKQKEGESVLSYVDRMTELSGRVIPKPSERQIIEKILDGLDVNMRNTVTMFDFESVEELTHRLKKVEASKKAKKAALRRENEKRATVFANVASEHETGLSREIKEIKSLLVSKQEERYAPKLIRRPPKCYKCDKIGHIAADCRTRNRVGRTENTTKVDKGKTALICDYCLKRGHIEAECYTKKRAIERKQTTATQQDANTAICMTEETLDSPQEALSTLLKNTEQRLGSLIYETLLLCGKPFRCLIDTGSQITIVSQETFNELGIALMPYVGPTTRSATLEKLKAVGQCELYITFETNEKKVVVSVTAMVVDRLPGGMAALIGQDVNGKANLKINCQNNSISLMVSAIETGTVHLPKCLTMKPRSSVLSEVSFSERNEVHDGTYYVSTKDHLYLINRVSLPNCLVDAKRGEAVVELTNFSDSAVTLCAGAVVGDYEYVEESPIVMVSAVLQNRANENQEEARGIEAKQEFKHDTSETKTILFQEKDIKVGHQLTDEQTEKLSEVLNKYPEAFALSAKDIGITGKIAHVINTGDHPPISAVPRRPSYEKRALTNKLVQELLNLNIIKPSNSPWSSPVVIVKKKTGDLRFCVDYRKLNKITKRDVYPLPNIQDALDALEGSEYFTCLDLKSGYYQIKMDQASKEKTAFITTDGLYEFNVMPFGLTNAPATFQRCMDIVLSGLKYNSVLVYLDDILVFSSSFEEHLLRLEAVLVCLEEAKLNLNPTKCLFCLPSMVYLGIKVTKEGQLPNEDKIKAVQEFPMPDNITAVKSFVSLCSYYRKFVKGFADIAKPLTHLMKTDVGFEWKNEQQVAFEQLKHALTHPPVLAHFNTDLPIEVRTDASNVGLGAVLVQEHPEGFKPVCFVSRQLINREQNYTTSEKECLAIVFALEKFRQYLEGRYFKIKTDHCSLCFLQSKQKLPARLLRWALLLQEFNFDIEYRSGRHNKDADCLSRFPSFTEEASGEHESDDKIFALVTSSDELEGVSLRQLQEQDEASNKIIKELERSPFATKKKQLKFFTLDTNGALYRIRRDGSEIHLLAYIPTKIRKTVMQANHDDTLSGHIGFSKTYNKIAEKYYWPGMFNSIKKYVEACPDCQAIKQPAAGRPSYLHPIIAKGPFSKVGIDIVGPLPSAGGKRYIIVAIDLFTKWVETRAISNQSAKTTARFLIEQILCRHGAPAVLISDQGRNFISSLVREVNEFMTTETRFTSAYHPKTNGQTERYNAILKTMLSAYVDEYHSNWDILLPVVTFAYNSAKQESTKFSPFELIYGRKPTLPLDIALLQTGSDEIGREDLIDAVKKNWAKIREYAYLASQEAKANMKSSFDQKANPISFNVGDYVLLRDKTSSTGLAKKLTAKWVGPYTVTEKISDFLYEIIPTAGRRKPERVNVERLKRFYVRYDDSDTEDDVCPPNEENNQAEEEERNDEDNDETILYELPYLKDESFDALFESSENPKVSEETSRASDITNKNRTEVIIPRRNPSREARPKSTANVVLQEGPPVAPRRSSLSGFLLKLLFTTFFLSIIPEMEGTLPTGYVILWRPTEQPVIQSAGILEVQVTLENPCDEIKNKLNMSTLTRNTFYNWCIHEVRRDVTLPMETLCKLGSSNRMTRGYLTVATISFGILAGISAIGYIANTNFRSSNGDEALQRTAILEETISELQRKYNKAIAQINKLSAEQSMLQSETLPTILSATRLKEKLMKTRFQIDEISQSWNRKKVSRQLFDLLNYTPHFEMPVDLMVPKSCTKADPEKYVFLIGFQRMEYRYRILKAEPFKTLIYIKNDTHICEKRYVGPEKIISDTKDDQVCFLQDPTDESPLHIGNKYDCGTRKVNKKEIQSTFYWKTSNCFLKDILYPPDYITVKKAPLYTHIYCPFSEITMLNRTEECPPYVFKLPENVTFAINNSTFYYEKIKADATIELTQSEMILLAFNLNNYLNMSAVLEYEPVIVPSSVRSYQQLIRILFYGLVLVLLTVIAGLVLLWKQTIKINWAMDEATLSSYYGRVGNPFRSQRITICESMSGRSLPDPPRYEETELVESLLEDNYMPLSVVNPTYGQTN